MRERDADIEEIQKRLDVTMDTLETAILWIAQAAGSPLSADNAGELLKKMRKARGYR